MRRVVLLVACCGAALLGAAPTALAADPILFVHGWNSNSSTWTTMVNRFAADGWTSAQLNNWSYNTSQSNATTASQIATKVDQIRAATGAAKVDIISHSMGGLSSRYYVKNLGGDLKVDEWVSLGGPNHGTDTANFCFSTACSEMRVGSQFLADLNAGDETPEGPTWVSIWTTQDQTVTPPDSARLDGALNLPVQSVCAGAQVGHGDLPRNPLVQELVLAELAAGDPVVLGPADCARLGG